MLDMDVICFKQKYAPPDLISQIYDAKKISSTRSFRGVGFKIYLW
jgi:hypothetical protein